MHVINARNMEHIKLAKDSFPRGVTFHSRYRVTSFEALNVIFHEQSHVDMPDTRARKQCRLARKTEFLYCNKVPEIAGVAFRREHVWRP
jgi:hypothetical protein